MTCTGFDVNGAKGPINFKAARGAGHKFVFLKASEGKTFKDSRFEQNRHAARDAGLLVGAYHFARPSNNKPKDEAINFLQCVGAHSTELLVLDFEDENGRGNLSEWAWEFLQIVEFLTHKRSLLYTYAPYWRAHGSTDPKFTHYPLWLAAYSASAPQLAPWGAYKFWQFTSSGSVPGVAGRVDLNRFVGHDLEILSLFNQKS